MNIGDKVLAEGVISAIGEGFVRIQFGRVGTQAVTHVRVALENVKSPAAPKTKAPKASDAD